MRGTIGLTRNTRGMLRVGVGGGWCMAGIMDGRGVVGAEVGSGRGFCLQVLHMIYMSKRPESKF